MKKKHLRLLLFSAGLYDLLIEDHRTVSKFWSWGNYHKLHSINICWMPLIRFNWPTFVPGHTFCQRAHLGCPVLWMLCSSSWMYFTGYFNTNGKKAMFRFWNSKPRCLHIISQHAWPPGKCNATIMYMFL